VLVRSNEQYTRSVSQLQHKYHVLHEQFKQRVQEIAQLKAERLHRKKAMGMYEFMLWSLASKNGGQGGAPPHLRQQQQPLEKLLRTVLEKGGLDVDNERLLKQVLEQTLASGGLNPGTGTSGGDLEGMLRGMVAQQTGGNALVDGAAQGKSIQAIIKREVEAALGSGRRGVRDNLDDYDEVRPSSPGGGRYDSGRSDEVLGPRKAELKRVQIEAQHVEQEVANATRELERWKVKLAEVEGLVEDTKRRTAEAQGRLEREQTRERQMGNRLNTTQGSWNPNASVNTQYGNLSSSAGAPIGGAQLRAAHPGQTRRSWSPGDNQGGLMSSQPLHQGGVPPAMPLRRVQSMPQGVQLPPPPPMGMVTAPASAAGRALPPYEAPDMSKDGSHFPHSETEVKEQKDMLQRALAEKLKAWELGQDSGKTSNLTDKALASKLGDQQELWKEERKALGIGQTDYDARRARLEKEVRSRVQDSIKINKMEGGAHDGVVVWGHEPAHKIQKDAQAFLNSQLDDGMPVLSREDERCLGVLFDVLSEGSPVLSNEHLGKLMNLKVLISANEASDIMSQMDVNKDGQVDFQEFRVYVIQAISQAFKKLDVDGNGHIDVEEIAPLGPMFNITTEADERQFRAKLDWAGDGRVQVNDFVSFVLEDSVERLTQRKFKTGDMPAALPILDAERVIRRLFDAHDADGSASLDTDEVMRLAMNLGLVSKSTHPGESEEEHIRRLVRDIKGVMIPAGEKVSNHEINFNEFRKWIINQISKKWNPALVEKDWEAQNKDVNAIFDKIQDISIYPRYLGYLMKACGVNENEQEKSSKVKQKYFMDKLIKGGFAERELNGAYSLEKEYFLCFVIMDFISLYLKSLDHAADALFYEDLPDFAPPSKGAPPLSYDSSKGRIKGPDAERDTLPNWGQREEKMPTFGSPKSNKHNARELLDKSYTEMSRRMGGSLKLSDLMDEEYIRSHEYAISQMERLKLMLRDIGWNGALDFDNYSRVIGHLLETSFGRLDTNNSGFIEADEVFAAADLMARGNKAEDRVYKKLVELTSNKVISEEGYAVFILEQVLNGIRPEEFKHAVMVLLSLGKDGRTPQVETEMKKIFRELTRRSQEGTLRGREFSALEEPLREVWGLNNEDPLLRFVRGSGDVTERDFVDFVSRLLDHSFELNDKGEGSLEVVILNRLAETFGDRTEKAYHRYMRSTILESGRTRVRRHEYFRVFTETMLAPLKRDELAESLNKLIDWSRPAGSKATTGAKLKGLLKDLFKAMKDSGREHIEGSQLVDLWAELKDVFGERDLRESGGALSRLSPEFFKGRIVEKEFISVMAAILQRVGDKLEGSETGGGIPQAAVESALGKREGSLSSDDRQGGSRHGALSRERYYEVVVDSCLSERNSGIVSMLVKLVRASSKKWERNEKAGVEDRTKAKLDQLFRKLDRDRNDYLDRSELGDFRRIFERVWDMRGDDELLRELSSSRVPRGDFIYFMNGVIERAFTRLDTERRGYLTRSEVWELSRTFGQHEGSFLESLDRDSNKKIDMAEFRLFACDVFLNNVDKGKFSEGLVKIIELAAAPSKRKDGRNVSLSDIEAGFADIYKKLQQEGSRVAQEELEDLVSVIKQEWKTERQDGKALNSIMEDFRRRKEVTRYSFADFSMTVLSEAFTKLDENQNRKLEYSELKAFSQHYISGSTSKDIVPGLEDKFDNYRSSGLSKLDFYQYICVEMLRGADKYHYHQVMKSVIQLASAKKDSRGVIDFNKDDKVKDDFAFEKKDEKSRLADSRRSDDFSFESDTGLSRTRDSVMTLGDSLASTDKGSRIERFDKSKGKKSEDTVIEELDSFDFES